MERQGLKRARTPEVGGALPAAALAEALMADSESAILLLDPCGMVAEINPAGLRLLSLKRAEARGQPAARLLRTVVPGDDVVREAFRRARLEREAVLLGPDGGEIPVGLHGYRLGRPPWVLLTLRDLAQMRRSQQELHRQERLATLGQLSAGIAHEIRNPLAGIGTSAQVLLRRFEPRDERSRFVRVILEEVGRLDHIVTSLLQYARPRVPVLEAGSLEACIRRVLELQSEGLEQARVQVEVDVAPRLPEVYIDGDLVVQVLLNVTLNALQAMSDGGTLRYEVRSVRRRRPGRGPGRRYTDRVDGSPGRSGSGRPARAAGWQTDVQVRVSDTGTGIPRGILDKLFDPFFSTKPRGSGLGLAISQTIMHEHGGTIEVASRERRGTAVLLNFPVEKRHGQRRKPNAH